MISYLYKDISGKTQSSNYARQEGLKGTGRGPFIVECLKVDYLIDHQVYLGKGGKQKLCGLPGSKWKYE